MREKSRRVGDVSREEEKMKAGEAVVAMYQGRELYSREKLDGYLRERYMVKSEREMVLQIPM